jgi:hypothetical protein
VATTGEAMPGGSPHDPCQVQGEMPLRCECEITGARVEICRDSRVKRKQVFRVWLLEGEGQASVLWSSPLSVARLRLICSTHSTHGAPADVHLFINPLASHHVCFILHLISYHLISSRHLIPSSPRLPPNAGGLMTTMASEFVFQCCSPDDRSFNH